MKIRVFDIDWDTSDYDEEDELQSGVCVPDLPSEVIIECDEEPDDNDENYSVNGILTNHYDFCVKGSCYEILDDDAIDEPDIVFHNAGLYDYDDEDDE